MNRDLWKWIFEAAPDEQLISIAKAINVSVPGFREVTAKNLPRIRSVLISMLLDPKRLLKVAKLTNERIRRHPELEQWRGQDVTGLLSLVHSLDDVRHILESLLSSEDEDHGKRAEAFYEELQGTGRLQSLEEAWKKERESERQEAQSEVERRQLRSELEDLRNKYEAQVKAVEKLKVKLHETQTKLDAALKLVEKQSREREREKKNFHERIRELERTLVGFEL
ncbi:hypothetical protein [Kyrpidia sp.]|uniref:hypothetical protein n=1 Tax=Kyrpidia sp. TaxID=2073077 RepID=UPI00183A7303|nr:hypothetical protein [Kyrpidia sp.]MCL6577634.1 hypothetical protein [Kyrpidia sp.]HHY67760.1 hypothetical protein [Alicyclobacillus sp.]